MTRIKKFKIFIKESVTEDDDMFQEFKDLGYIINTGATYYTDEGIKAGNKNDRPKYRDNEKTGTVVYLKDKEGSEYLDLDSYIEKQKEILDILDKIKYRSNVDILIENDIPTMIFSGQILDDDKSKVVKELTKLIEDFADSKFTEIDPDRNFSIEKDGYSIRIEFPGSRNIDEQFFSFRKFMNSKQVRDMLSKINDELIRKVPQKMLDQGISYSHVDTRLIYIKLIKEE